MPPITDPAVLEQIKRQQAATNVQVQPMPFPGAIPLPPTSIRPQAQMQNDEERLRLARQAAQLDAERLRLTSQSGQREQVKANREQKQADITGGVDTTESENTAAFLTTQLTKHAQRIDELNKQFPEAAKPGWKEWFGSWFGERGRAFTTPQEVLDARIQLNNRYRMAADVLLTLGTGAAYTAEQKAAYTEAYAPQVTDTPGAIADKKRLMVEAIEAARAKSGAAVGQIDRAVQALNQLYGTEHADEKKELGSTATAITPPEDYQKEHDQFIASHAGKLTLGEYLTFRMEADKRYLPSMQANNRQPFELQKYDLQEMQKYVDDVNKTGGKSSRIPSTNLPLENKTLISDQGRANFGMTPFGTGLANFGNAGSMGAVDAMISPGNKEAFQLENEKNWKSALAGEVVGSLAPMKGLEMGGAGALRTLKALPAATARNKFLGDVAVNSVYGGVRGAAGADEDEGLESVFKGVAAGAGGAVGGNLLTKGMTSLTSRAFQSAVELAPAKTIQAFNRDNANRALAYIGKKVPKRLKSGLEITDTVHKELSTAYDDIKPAIGGSADGTFDTAITAIKASATTSEKKAMYQEIADAVNLFKDPTTGHYTGQGYKDASERLRYLVKQWSTKGAMQGDVAADDMARAAEQARKNMQLMIQRHTPEAGQRLKQIERGWAHLVRIENASNRALKDEGVYTPGQYLEGIKQLDTSARKNATARGRGFDQPFAMASEKVLGSKGVPTLSLGERLRFATIMGGSAAAMAHDPKAIAIVSALSYGLYGPRAKQITRSILLGKRPTALDNQYVRRIIEDASRHKMTGS